MSLCGKGRLIGCRFKVRVAMTAHMPSYDTYSQKTKCGAAMPRSLLLAVPSKASRTNPRDQRP